jgi:tetraacyldisaccharide-1-P 4'-kinase
VTDIERLKLLVTDSQAVAEAFKRQNQELMDRLDAERARAERAEALLQDMTFEMSTKMVPLDIAKRSAKEVAEAWEHRATQLVEAAHRDKEKAESACAAYRAALEAVFNDDHSIYLGLSRDAALKLLEMSDAGRGYANPETVRLAVEALKEAMSVMVMQEGREKGDFEISSVNAWAVWSEAKTKAAKALAALEACL